MASWTYSLVNLVVGKLDVMIKERGEMEDAVFLEFREDFEWLSNMLTVISGYLGDADVKSRNNESVGTWLLDAAEIAWDAEDTLEEFAIQSKATNNENTHSSCVCAFSYSKLAFRSKMKGRIKDFKNRIRSIAEEAAELKLIQEGTPSDLPSTSTAQNVKWRGSNVIESDSRSVAIESKVQDVLSLLDDPASPVIAIVGRGGVGKTFLLQNVFNSVKDRYERSIWLSISQTYSVGKMQAALASELELDLSEVVNGQVRGVLAAFLINERLGSITGRCLIVLDDVWRATGEDDLLFSLGLPRGNNTSRCKIVITTRSRAVNANMEARIYEVQPLSEEESWNLFCAFAFPDCLGNQPPEELVGIARQIESECGRLPLAVKTVAASLASEKSSREWESKLGQLKATSYTDDPIMQILLLSYVSLPDHLKPCFAFLSFFHEDMKIDPQYLISLWIAEELIPQGDNQRDIGWSHIYHLQSLCLVEIVDDNYAQQNQWLKLHDLLLDLAIGVSKQSKCEFSVKEAFKKGPSAQTRIRYRSCRRILLAGQDIDNHSIAKSSVGSTGSVKTLSLCDNIFSTIPERFFASVKVLRILDLSCTHISTLPESVANLRLLRLLNLGRTKITQVPDCIRKIGSLRFLNISGCRKVTRLPEWIGELKYLEHLNVAGCSDELASYMPAGISKLFSLQILTSDYLNLSIQENKLLKLEHFASLTRLEELCINVNHREELEAIEEGVLEQLVKLRSLAMANEIPLMQFKNAADLPSLPDSMKAMRNIEKLFLWNFEVPSWVCGFQKLSVIEIGGDCRNYPELETMLSLETLCLLDNPNCRALPRAFGGSSGFQNLRYLEISGFPLLEEIPKFEHEAMPRLEKLWIIGCESVNKVPADGLEHLKRLKRIVVYPSPEIMEELKVGGEYWNKIKANNPNMIIDLFK